MIRITIERHIAVTLESPCEGHSRTLLRRAIDRPGFISTEALVGYVDSNHHLTFCNWRCREARDRTVTVPEPC